MNVLLPFSDDSSLLGASRLAKQYAASGAEVFFAQIYEGNDLKLSDRQIKESLQNKKIDFYLKANDLLNEDFLSFFQVVATNRVHQIYVKLAHKKWNSTKPRPALVAFSSGLEFFPEVGYKNRSFFDVIFFNSPEELSNYKSSHDGLNTHQHLDVGNPFFVCRKDLIAAGGAISRANICFFAQAHSPLKLEARIELLKILLELATKNPSLKVGLKLRHAENENVLQFRNEVFSYPWILDRVLKVQKPVNFEFVVSSMEECLPTYTNFVSCSSTATIEALAHQRNSYFWSDFPGSDRDEMSIAIKKIFGRASFQVTTQQIQSLVFPKIDPIDRDKIVVSENYLVPSLKWIADFQERQIKAGPAAFNKLAPGAAVAPKTSTQRGLLTKLSKLVKGTSGVDDRI